MSTTAITFRQGAEGVLHNGKPYKKRAVSSPTSALEATLHIILAHTADVFNATVNAISETYGIDSEEMFEAIRTHPDYMSIQVHPAVKDLGYIEEKRVAPAAAAPVPAPVLAAPAPEPMESLSTMMQNASLGTAAQFAQGPAALPAAQFAQGPAPQFAQGTAAPQKKKFKIKKPAGTA